MADPGQKSSTNRTVPKKNWLTKLGEKWRDWVGDRELEQDIRKQLNKSGYLGRSARFSFCHLVAIQRPGWVQIHAFDVSATPTPGGPDEAPDHEINSGEPSELDYGAEDFGSTSKVASRNQGPILLFGLAQDDGRASSKVLLFLSRSEREAQFKEWTSDPRYIVKKRVDWSR